MTISFSFYNTVLLGGIDTCEFMGSVIFTCEFMDSVMFTCEVEKFMIEKFFTVVKTNSFYTFHKLYLYHIMKLDK